MLWCRMWMGPVVGCCSQFASPGICNGVLWTKLWRLDTSMAGQDPSEVHRKGSIVALDEMKSKVHKEKSNGHGIRKSHRCLRSHWFFEVSRILAPLDVFGDEESAPLRRGKVQTELLELSQCGAAGTVSMLREVIKSCMKVHSSLSPSMSPFRSLPPPQICPKERKGFVCLLAQIWMS